MRGVAVSAVEWARSFGQDASVARQAIRPGTVRRMLRFAAPHIWLLVAFLMIVAFDATIGIANPLIYRAIINDGIIKGNSTLTIHLAVLVGVLALVSSALGVAQSYFSARIGARTVLSLRSKLFEHILQMPIAFFTRTQTGALVSRLNNDVSGAQNAFTDVLSNVVGNIITVVLILAAMLLLSWQIAIAAVVLLPFFIWPSRFWGVKLQAITRESYDLSASLSNFMVERFNVAGAQLAKLFGNRENEIKAFDTQAARVADIGVQRTIYARLFFAGLLLTAYFATALAYGWGGVLAIKHIIDVGTVVALVSYLSRLYGPLAGLSNIQVSVKTALVSFDRVFEVLDLPPMIRERPGAVAIPEGPATVSFDHVSFRYPAAPEVSLASLESVATPDNGLASIVLRDITFNVEPGQLVALVGPSGAGKSTIAQLIARLYDIQRGEIKVNGVDVRDAKLDSLHRRIGIVSQDPHLFHDTIRANLRYAKPEATILEIEEALRAAQILSVVSSLPNGLDTLVGERGYRFSGGEKQRLAIARLLLKAPDIVILDEATAHLDSDSEAAVQKALEIALAGRTSIVIAHRLSTIVKADQILVIQDGCIVQRGKHRELLESQGIYRELYWRQASFNPTWSQAELQT